MRTSGGGARDASRRTTAIPAGSLPWMQPTMSTATAARASPRAVAVMGCPSTEEPSFTVIAAGRPAVVVSEARVATEEGAPCPHAASATLAMPSRTHGTRPGLLPWLKGEARWDNGARSPDGQLSDGGRSFGIKCEGGR